jgi:hypothetical protein
MKPMFICVVAVAVSGLQPVYAQDSQQETRTVVDRSPAAIEKNDDEVSERIPSTEDPRQTLRCFQHGVRIVDEEVKGSVTNSQPGSLSFQVSILGGRRLAVIATGETLCVLKVNR